MHSRAAVNLDSARPASALPDAPAVSSASSGLLLSMPVKKKGMRKIRVRSHVRNLDLPADATDQPIVERIGERGSGEEGSDGGEENDDDSEPSE